MKKILIPILTFTLFATLSVSRGQDPAQGVGYAAVQEIRLSPQQLEELVSPIALYPDPLIALVLPASTVPTDVVLAARYLKNGQNVNQADLQNWEPSVKSLTRYPDVLNMMDENLDWTNQLGTAVIAQQGDVMQAIQNQRAKASALGNLMTTPQQQVVVEQQIIQIIPADPEIIYVPQYNPEVVYVEAAPLYSPFVSFSIGFAMGAWLTNDCDWSNRGFYVNHWGNNGWRGYPRYNNVNININRNNYWKPNPHRPAPRPSYVPNRASYAARQTMPTFRQPPQGGWNGGSNRNQAGQTGRSAEVSPAVVNSQTRPNRSNPATAVTPAPVARPAATSLGVANPQNRSYQPQSAAMPNPNQNTRTGYRENNGQDRQGPRDGVTKDGTQGNRSWNGGQPNQGRSAAQAGEAPLKSPVAPRPQPEAPALQPAVRPQTSQWRNPQPPASAPQVPQPRPVRTPTVNPQIPQSRPSPQAPANFQGQPKRNPQQPVDRPPVQQDRSQPRPAASSNLQRQNGPQQMRFVPRAQDQAVVTPPPTTESGRAERAGRRRPSTP